MNDVSRIRALIGQGKTDAEISAIVNDGQDEKEGVGWDSPSGMFRVLSSTMRRAVLETWPVAPHEVLKQLTLFRILWEEVAANGDAAGVHEHTLDFIETVSPGDTLAIAFDRLHTDLTYLVRPVPDLNADEREYRAAIELRHRLNVDGFPVICFARIASVLAEMSARVYQALSAKPSYKDLFPVSILQPCVDIIVLPRDTWSSLLKQADKSLLKTKFA